MSHSLFCSHYCLFLTSLHHHSLSFSATEKNSLCCLFFNSLSKSKQSQNWAVKVVWHTSWCFWVAFSHLKKGVLQNRSQIFSVRLDLHYLITAKSCWQWQKFLSSFLSLVFFCICACLLLIGCTSLSWMSEGFRESTESLFSCFVFQSHCLTPLLFFSLSQKYHIISKISQLSCCDIFHLSLASSSLRCSRYFKVMMKCWS